MFKRTVSLRRFFWVPTTCFGWEIKKLNFRYTLKLKSCRKLSKVAFISSCTFYWVQALETKGSNQSVSQHHFRSDPNTITIYRFYGNQKLLCVGKLTVMINIHFIKNNLGFLELKPTNCCIQDLRPNFVPYICWLFGQIGPSKDVNTDQTIYSPFTFNDTFFILSGSGFYTKQFQVTILKKDAQILL